MVGRLLDTAGITPAPRGVTAAHTRRTSTDQHLAARAAELGFTSLRAYLADRAVTRRWPSTMIASELGVQPATVDIYRAASVATPTGRPRPFNKKTKKGTSDHLPITAVLTY